MFAAGLLCTLIVWGVAIATKAKAKETLHDYTRRILASVASCNGTRSKDCLLACKSASICCWVRRQPWSLHGEQVLSLQVFSLQHRSDRSTLLLVVKGLDGIDVKMQRVFLHAACIRCLFVGELLRKITKAASPLPAHNTMSDEPDQQEAPPKLADINPYLSQNALSTVEAEVLGEYLRMSTNLEKVGQSKRETLACEVLMAYPDTVHVGS